MNDSLSLSESATARLAERHVSGLCQRLVLDAFRQMKAGCLRLRLPDGTNEIIGTPGEAVSAEIRVSDPAFFKRCVLFGDVGFAEGYIEGEWETESIERVIAWAILNLENAPGASGSKVRRFALNLFKGYNRLRHLLRPNSLEISRRNISEHYDLGNEFYELWLDPTMTYSSGYFAAPGQSLEAAQHAKYDALCRRLHLRASDQLLEIGCGWGGLSVHAARHYGCRVTAVTISQEQHRYATERMRREGLSELVEVRLQDYRKIEGQFDKIASIEMMEALGDRYLETFFTAIHRLLARNGIVALQYITVPDSRHAELRRNIDFIQKHIFPGSLLLSVGRVNQAINRTGDLFLHQLEDMGASYARTLRLWWEQFNARIDDVKALGFDARFIRKWNYYLQYCEAAFAMRNISVVQAIYTRPNNLNLHQDFFASPLS